MSFIPSIHRMALLLAAEGDGVTIGGLMMAAGATLLTIWALAKTRQRLSKIRERDNNAPSERLKNLKQRSNDRESVESLMVDAEELTRRLAAQLDNKAARLEKLIADADQRLARLESAVSRQQTPTASASGMDDFAPPAEDPLTREVHRLADDGLSPIEIAQQLSEQVGKVELILALRESEPTQRSDQKSAVSK